MSVDYTRLIEGLVPKLDGESAVRHRTALVDAVNADGTVDLDFDGTIVPDVSVLQGAAVAVGATVQVAAWAGDLLVLGMTAGFQTAFAFGGSVYFTSSDTFTKANYPGLRAVKARCQAGGGGGAGAAVTAAGQGSTGSGGGGGGYAESFILVADLDTSEAVTVGTGGAGGSGASGSNGNDSVFDTISGEVRAKGGFGGTTLGASAANGFVSGGNGGDTNTGDLDVGGTAGGIGIRTSTSSTGGPGGASHMGGGGNGSVNATAQGGRAYGGGGGGAGNNPGQGATRLGGTGAPGVVIVDLYF